jgi:hypothetical protein
MNATAEGSGVRRATSRETVAAMGELAYRHTPVICYDFRQSDRVVRVSEGVVACQEPQNYAGCLVTTGTSGSEVRGEVHARLLRLFYGVLAVSRGLRLFYFLPPVET